MFDDVLEVTDDGVLDESDDNDDSSVSDEDDWVLDDLLVDSDDAVASTKPLSVTLSNSTDAPPAGAKT